MLQNTHFPLHQKMRLHTFFFLMKSVIAGIFYSATVILMVHSLPAHSKTIEETWQEVAEEGAVKQATLITKGGGGGAGIYGKKLQQQGIDTNKFLEHLARTNPRALRKGGIEAAQALEDIAKTRAEADKHRMEAQLKHADLQRKHLELEVVARRRVSRIMANVMRQPEERRPMALEGAKRLLIAEGILSEQGAGRIDLMVAEIMAGEVLEEKDYLEHQRKMFAIEMEQKRVHERRELAQKYAKEKHDLEIEVKQRREALARYMSENPNMPIEQIQRQAVAVDPTASNVQRIYGSVPERIRANAYAEDVQRRVAVIDRGGSAGGKDNGPVGENSFNLKRPMDEYYTIVRTKQQLDMYNKDARRAGVAEEYIIENLYDVWRRYPTELSGSEYFMINKKIRASQLNIDVFEKALNSYLDLKTILSTIPPEIKNDNKFMRRVVAAAQGPYLYLRYKDDIPKHFPSVNFESFVAITEAVRNMGVSYNSEMIAISYEDRLLKYTTSLKDYEDVHLPAIMKYITLFLSFEMRKRYDLHHSFRLPQNDIKQIVPESKLREIWEERVRKTGKSFIDFKIEALQRGIAFY